MYFLKVCQKKFENEKKHIELIRTVRDYLFYNKEDLKL